MTIMLKTHGILCEGNFWRVRTPKVGGKRVRMLAEDDYGEFFNKKLHKYAHDIKGMHLELSQQLFNCDGVKGGF